MILLISFILKVRCWLSQEEPEHKVLYFLKNFFRPFIQNKIK